MFPFLDAVIAPHHFCTSAQEVMYVKGVGSEEKIVVLADAEYNEIELPLTRFVGYSSVDEGATAVLYKDDDEIVKIVVK